MKQKQPLIIIYRLGSEAPVRFAAGELARILGKMTGRQVRVQAAAEYRPGEAGIWLGTAAAVAGHIAMPATQHSLDDGIVIRSAGGHAVVAGVNPRSVVFAAYRFLEELGCRWLRPGRAGERIPRVKDPFRRTIRISERPAYRYRCICIEGSCSFEHVRDVIAYAARRGFNAYFLQFRTSYTFFNRWYAEENPGRAKRRLTLAQAAALRERVKNEALRRGMSLHVVGHGWTCEPFGIPGLEWAAYKKAVPARVRRNFAQVKGRRELWGGVPLNTNLCYSAPRVRRVMARSVADYAAAHPEEDVIHVWLADGTNNQCECAGCRARRPSDFYVMILNEIDALLSARKLATRIVFLAYVDLLWAPERERLRNPERFILMFAPITRSYAEPFLGGRKHTAERPGPYRRNRLVFPSSPSANLAMLKGWRRRFSGDCVDFDYHLMWELFAHPGQLALAEVLFKDIRDLARLGMQGFISCQIQRASFPTGLFWHVMGKTLWNRNTSFGALVDDYLADCFGREGRAVKRYLADVTRLAHPHRLRLLAENREGAGISRRQMIDTLQQVPALVRGMAPRVRRGCRNADPVTASAWELLREHGWYVTAYARFYSALLAKDPLAKDLAEQWERDLDRSAARLHPVLDTWSFRGRLKGAYRQAQKS